MRDVCTSEIEFDRYHALPGRVLEILEDALVTGIGCDHEHEAGGRRESLAKPIDDELAAVIEQRVQHDDGISARFDDLVEITDRALLDGAGQRTVLPDRFAALEPIAADEIRCGQLFIARHSKERAHEIERKSTRLNS